MKERRRAKRLAIRIPISWQWEGSKKENLTDAFLVNTQNITTSGLFLRSNLRPREGSLVKLELNLNNKSGPITLRGKVIWIANKKKQPYLYPGIAIKFEDIKQDCSKKIARFIKNKLANFRDANELKNMYLKLKAMASRLVELEERHSTVMHFKKVINNAIHEIDDIAHILDREINEIKKM